MLVASLFCCLVNRTLGKPFLVNEICLNKSKSTLSHVLKRKRWFYDKHSTFDVIYSAIKLHLIAIKDKISDLHEWDLSVGGLPQTNPFFSLLVGHLALLVNKIFYFWIRLLSIRESTFQYLSALTRVS